MKTQIINDLLGSLTIVNYVVAYIFIFLALILKWTFKTNKAIKKDPNSPDKFVFAYWWNKNAIIKFKSFLAIIIVSFVSLRFSTDYFNIVFSYALTFAIGMTIDWWIHRVRNIKKLVPNFFNKGSK